MAIYAVILAAGLGTRMKSSIPKVLHPILGKPVISHIVDTMRDVSEVSKTVIVISTHSEAVKGLYPDGDILFAYQDNMLGTADALKDGLKGIDSGFDDILVMTGDTPLISKAAINGLIERHLLNKNGITMLTFLPPDPASYGRVLRDGTGRVISVIEEKDASVEQKATREVNSGIYLFSKRAVALLPMIQKNPLKGEYYLTDIISIALSNGLNVEGIPASDYEEVTGINTRLDLHMATRFMQRRINMYHMSQGVTILDMEGVFIEPTVKIGRDTVIYPNVFIEGDTVIGESCLIRSNSRIVGCRLEDNVTIKDSCLLEESTVQPHAVIGPFAHLRPGSIVRDRAKIGNFVETKKADVGKGTKISHLSYIGDASIGADVNIGAGTITCNYDGIKKYKTTIGDSVFIGSDTQLVAPVIIEHDSFVAAGSTITKNVPAESLALSRVKQKNMPGWAKKRIRHGKEE